MKRMIEEDDAMRRMTELKSRRWRYSDGWLARLMELLGAVGNRGPSPATTVVRSGRGVIVAVGRLESRRWQYGGDCSNGDCREGA